MAALKRTPLYESHANAGAKIVEFAGWEMPIVYTSTIEEHKAVREGAGIFDVSHMGEIFVGGQEVARFLDYLLTNDIALQSEGTALYSHMTNEKGGVIDDLIVYRLNHNMDLLVVNASRLDSDWAWIQKQAKNFKVTINNESPNFCIVALQGPASLSLAVHLNQTITQLKRFQVTTFVWENHEVTVARTGYTGEDGFEFICENEVLPKLWEALVATAKKQDIKPFALCGLGARDTLRLEAGYPLWGHELNEEITPLEAGFEWVVKWNKSSFIGKVALENLKKTGLEKKLFGFLGHERGPIPRQGHSILTAANIAVGRVTSGSFSPMLNRPIALGFLNKEAWGQKNFFIEVNGRMLPVSIHSLPFYKSPSPLLGARS